jgi:inhibitor of cysteine peptidase
MVLQAEVGKELVITLDANPTTGHSWAASFDQEHLAMVGQEYRATSDRIGGGGKAEFTFRPIKQGRASLVLRYMRPWEREAVKVLTYEIVIS